MDVLTYVCLNFNYLSVPAAAVEGLRAYAVPGCVTRPRTMDAEYQTRNISSG